MDSRDPHTHPRPARNVHKGVLGEEGVVKAGARDDVLDLADADAAHPVALGMRPRRPWNNAGARSTPTEQRGSIPSGLLECGRYYFLFDQAEPLILSSGFNHGNSTTSFGGDRSTGRATLSIHPALTIYSPGTQFQSGRALPPVAQGCQNFLLLEEKDTYSYTPSIGPGGEVSDVEEKGIKKLHSTMVSELYDLGSVAGAAATTSFLLYL
ncbi:hypothetical protein C8F04DRAFT_1186435 [Mycena alexandri]|uniref:Uncharacterized protein n=1 Tax=Mycena alexandri TaxID=1745969 RepID=A0AAD6SND9_9AGAR|nr:hypothetical protein C8F04DRAFT_1186435 [Mycena alexandri]